MSPEIPEIIAGLSAAAARKSFVSRTRRELEETSHIQGRETRGGVVWATFAEPSAAGWKGSEPEDRHTAALSAPSPGGRFRVLLSFGDPSGRGSEARRRGGAIAASSATWVAVAVAAGEREKKWSPTVLFWCAN